MIAKDVHYIFESKLHISRTLSCSLVEVSFTWWSAGERRHDMVISDLISTYLVAYPIGERNPYQTNGKG